jgi:hypothetical protein
MAPNGVTKNFDRLFEVRVASPCFCSILNTYRHNAGKGYITALQFAIRLQWFLATCLYT